jgi:single-strand DNA-binding protein
MVISPGKKPREKQKKSWRKNMDLNSVNLIGRLTRDPELIYTTNETPILSFTIANNRRKKDGEEWVDDVNFFDCVMIGQRAEHGYRHLKKSVRIGISGFLSQHTHKAQNGDQKYKVEVKVSEYTLLSNLNELDAMEDDLK